MRSPVDQVNDKYGRDTKHFLTQGLQDAFWHMKRNKMSGHMTTKWDQLVKVKTGC
ncbi:DUF4113 domain-containing protein [Deltaproteobacteria bacterium OttesenSCG-928-M10]|nr:DUF4113 domain-containing protein [Deltaproteobacteria bacterium OttesenSCG-928-M10]